jgi:hypothetical protein
VAQATRALNDAEFSLSNVTQAGLAVPNAPCSWTLEKPGRYHLT